MAQTILITGASSGIGEALAHYYAQTGTNLALCARSLDKLEALQQTLQQQAPQVKIACYRLDVSQTEQVYQVIEQAAQDFGQLDSVIANAGITGVRRTGSGDMSLDNQILATNLTGAIATIDAAVKVFKQQGFGQIVGISSFSAYRGIPGSAAYSASKAALSNYMQAVRTELATSAIEVCTIHPGFIHTNIDKHISKYPFVIPAAKAAATIGQGLAKGKKDIIVPGWPWRVLKHLMPLVPDALINKIF